MRRPFCLIFLAAALSAPTLIPAQATTQPPPSATDPLAPLDFLTGTWNAQTTTGSAAANASGTYTFRRDLNGHVLDRTSSADSCTGLAAFDCSHHDRLTLFSDPNGVAMHRASLFAFYIDSEGHVIYYTVSLPDPHTVVLLSQGLPTAPRFRLVYHLDGSGPTAILSGKFQTAAPGSDDFHSYLEWSGTRH